MEPLEKEEAFYRYEDGKMIRQTGFYVYYEKNEAMRNYLVSQNEKSEKKSEEVDDAAVHTFRKKIEKKTGQEQKKAGFPLFKTASVCAAAAVLAVGVLYLNDYKKLKGTEAVLADLENTRQEENKEAVTPVNAPSAKKDQREEKQEEQIAEKVEDKDRNQQEVQNQTELEKEAAADTPAHQSYTIQPGDTMTRISVKNYGTIKKIKEICELNNMSETDTIYPGQIILLP